MNARAPQQHDLDGGAGSTRRHTRLASATSVEQLAQLTTPVDLRPTVDELTRLDTASAAFA